MSQITLSEAVDEAVDKLPPIRRRVAQFNLGRPRYRKQFMDMLAVELMEDPRMIPIGNVAVFGAENFTEDTPININEGYDSEFIDLIIEYLPQILKVLMMLLVFLTLLIALCLAIPGDQAVASDPPLIETVPAECLCVECDCVDCDCPTVLAVAQDCPGGICPVPQATVSSSGRSCANGACQIPLVTRSVNVVRSQPVRSFGKRIRSGNGPVRGLLRRLFR